MLFGSKKATTPEAPKASSISLRAKFIDLSAQFREAAEAAKISAREMNKKWEPVGEKYSEANVASGDQAIKLLEEAIALAEKVIAGLTAATPATAPADA